jgi:uncharacterized membrane protein
MKQTGIYKMKLTMNTKSNGHLSTVSRMSLFTALVVTSMTTAVAQPRYTLTELPTVAGYEETVGYQINDQGYVVGTSSGPKSGNQPVATVWKNGSVSILGKLKDGTYSVATAINSKGVIVGDGDDGDGRPLGWILSGGKMVNFFSNNGGNTRPIAINEAGQVGGYYIKGFSGRWRGAIWTVDAKDPRKSTKIDLPLLPGGDPLKDSCVPLGFNKSNQAAGYVSNSTIGQHATFWNNDGSHSIVDLGVFEYDWSSLALAINDLGQVVGSSHPPFGSRPVLWDNDAAHTAIELPLLPGDNYGSAHIINNDGTIVGFSAASEAGTWNVSPSRQVIWIGGQVYDFISILDESASGWTFGEMMSINNKGQMVGAGFHNGVPRAMILSPVL